MSESKRKPKANPVPASKAPKPLDRKVASAHERARQRSGQDD
jgi:hypothetical protein